MHACDATNNGGCSQICNKIKEKHECACQTGFVLANDGRTCKKGERNNYIWTLYPEV